MLDIGFPGSGKNLLNPTYLKFTGQLGADPAYKLKIGKSFRSQEDSAEHLVIEATVKMLYKFSIRQTGIRLQKHQGQLALRIEVCTTAFAGFFQLEGFDQFTPGDNLIDFTQFGFQEFLPIKGKLSL